MLHRLFLSAFLLVSLHAAPHIEQNRIILDAAFSFIGDTEQLAPASNVALQQLAEFLAAKPTLTRIRIEGHLARKAGDTGAQSLSERRALAVARALVAADVDCARLLAVGFGDTKPVAAPADAAENTRIEIHVAALRGHLIGGMPEDGGGHPAGDPCGK